MMWRIVERLFARRLDGIWRDGYEAGCDDTEAAMPVVEDDPAPPRQPWMTAPQPAAVAESMMLGVRIALPAPYDPARAHAWSVARFGPDPADEAERSAAEWRGAIRWWADEAYRAIGALAPGEGR